uniref:Uncharacterized protein n=1 Tax=Chromera velia CCMP2878 TaxID=1169474 RepID=A0A0G4H2P8_9ALVE|eukprot:Cvel_24472.t1-p1 / transcript=Cvel_24472.t1 / gene=Cvel_24472 / organism=Chromera_velia_CCMP2878 / gene_product=hypothetical protein / transcript_product=hypothetical protein / location=Cvel_scaffold2648:23054-23566(-) / protein_length=171 / sequence_SO=supercontig / SO=protein_coding / is_pseudo=false
MTSIDSSPDGTITVKYAFLHNLTMNSRSIVDIQQKPSLLEMPGVSALFWRAGVGVHAFDFDSLKLKGVIKSLRRNQVPSRFWDFLDGSSVVLAVTGVAAPTRGVCFRRDRKEEDRERAEGKHGGGRVSSCGKQPRRDARCRRPAAFCGRSAWHLPKFLLPNSAEMQQKKMK